VVLGEQPSAKEMVVPVAGVRSAAAAAEEVEEVEEEDEAAVAVA